MLDASFRLSVRVNCTRCRKEIAIPGVVRELMCGGCGELNALGDSFWTGMLTAARFTEALLAEGPVETVNPDGLLGRVELQRTSPQCQACHDAELARRDVPAAATVGHWSCPRCNATVPVRPADELVRAFLPAARFVVHEAAPLQRPTSARPRAYTFFLICDYEEGELRDLQWARGKKRLADATRSGLTPRQYALMADHDDLEVRCALAGNTAVPGDVLGKLAADRSDRVRSAVARNPNAPIDTLLALAADRDPDVQRAFAERAVIPAEIVEALASAASWQAREIAAAHPAISEATLRRLCSDAHATVADVARARASRQVRVASAASTPSLAASIAPPPAVAPSAAPTAPTAPTAPAAPTDDAELRDAADALAQVLARPAASTAQPLASPSRPAGAGFYVAAAVIVLAVAALGLLR